MTNPSVVERRGPAGAVARALGWIRSALVVRPVLLAVLLGALLMTLDVVTRVAVGVDRGVGMALFVSAVVLMVPVHAADSARRRRADALECVAHLSPRHKRMVVQAVRRGEDVGSDELAPAVLAYVVAERSGEAQRSGFDRWSLRVGSAFLLGLIGWWAIVEIASPVRWLVVLLSTAVLLGLWTDQVTSASRRERRREEAVALARPRAERHWDARDRGWRQGRGRRARDVLDRGPVPVPRFGDWSDEPLWSIGVEDPHDPAPS